MMLFNLYNLVLAGHFKTNEETLFYIFSIFVPFSLFATLFISSQNQTLINTTDIVELLSIRFFFSVIVI